jgi:hypothetical protein
MPAFVQQVANTANNTASLVLTLPANAAAGNVVAVSLTYYNGTPRTVSLSGLGATWTRLYQQSTDNAIGVRCELWVGQSVAGGSAAVTVTFSGNTYSSGNAAEFSGVNTVGSATGALSTGTTATTTAQTLNSGDIAYGLLSWADTATPTYTDSPGAWTALTSIDQPGSGQNLAPAYRVATGSESATRQVTLSVSKPITVASVALTATTSVSGALTAARTARSFSLTGGIGKAASLTALRAARAFSLSAGLAKAASLAAGRTARGFSLTAHANLPAAAGRPDADTATGWPRLDRGFYLDADADPPVDPPPPFRPPKLHRRSSWSITPPTYAADGWSHPKQTKTIIDTSVVGRFRHRFGGYDRTFFRGVRTKLLQDGHASPFGPTIAVYRFGQIMPFERPGVGALSWLHDGTRVVTTLVDQFGVTVPGWAFIGFVHNLTPELQEGSLGLTVEAKGFLYQADDAVNKPLPYTRGAGRVTVGKQLKLIFNHVVGRLYPALAEVDTSPASTWQRGSLSQSVVGFARDLLAEAWTADGRQWTVLDVPGVKRALIQLPDPSTIDATVSVGQPGVVFDLDEEQDEQPNVVYGEWIDPNGGRHQRLKYPRLHEDRSPTYPLSVGAVFDAGDGHTGFQPFSDWMRRNGFSGFDSQDTYLASDVDDVKAAQKRMGITVDGVVGAQTWGTAFNTGADVGDLFAAIYLPIACRPRVEPYLYAPDGAKLGRNPAYDSTVRRKETYVNFGEGLTYRDVRRSAQQIVDRSISGISLVGQITLNTDPEELSRSRPRRDHDARPLPVRHRQRRREVPPRAVHRVLRRRRESHRGCDVDTKWRDAYTVAQIIERNKAAPDDPARAPPPRADVRAVAGHEDPVRRRRRRPDLPAQRARRVLADRRVPRRQLGVVRERDRRHLAPRPSSR